MNDLAKNLLLWVVIAVVLVSAFQSFSSRSGVQAKLGYSDFLEQVKSGAVDSAEIEGQNIRGKLKSGQSFAAVSPETINSGLIKDLIDNKVKFDGALPKETPLLMQILLSFGPICC